MAMYRIFNLPILKLCQRNREAMVYKFDYFLCPAVMHLMSGFQLTCLQLKNGVSS